MDREPLPDGHVRVFATRKHNGQERRTYIGRAQRGSLKLLAYDHRNREHAECDLSEVMGPELLQTHEMLASAAATAGCSFSAAGNWLREILPELLERFPLTAALPTSPNCGRMGPDSSENSDAGPSHRQLA